MKSYCFFNGEVMPLEEARVSISDIGLLRGFGIYDALTVIKGKPLHFHDHYERIAQGAEALGLKVPITEKVAEEKTIEIVLKSGFLDRANVRMILTGGETIGGIEFNPSEPTFYILTENWHSLPPETYKSGVRVITEEFMREWPRVKSTNYIRAVTLQEKKKKEGALEVLYIWDGKVFECATSNVFLVKNGIIITPDTNVLLGVTRKIVLKLSEKDYKIERREVSFQELKSADEVFITASFKDIVPVVKVDDFKIGDGSVGKITRDLMGKFAKYLS